MLITPDQKREVYCPCGNDGCFMSWCSGQMIANIYVNGLIDGKKTHNQRHGGMSGRDFNSGNRAGMGAWRMRFHWGSNQTDALFCFYGFNIYVFLTLTVLFWRWLCLKLRRPLLNRYTDSLKDIKNG